MNFTRSLFVVAAASSLAIAACSGETDAEKHETNDQHGGATPDRPFSETVVHVNEDGTTNVEVFYRSASEVAADRNQGTVAREGTSDGRLERFLDPCFAAAVAVWDGRDGTGNKACFFGSTTQDVKLDLSLQRRPDGTPWAGEIESFQSLPLGMGGIFSDSAADASSCTLAWSPGQPLTNVLLNVAICVTRTRFVYINKQVP